MNRPPDSRSGGRLAHYGDLVLLYLIAFIGDGFLRGGAQCLLIGVAVFAAGPAYDL